MINIDNKNSGPMVEPCGTPEVAKKYWISRHNNEPTGSGW